MITIINQQKQHTFYSVLQEQETRDKNTHIPPPSPKKTTTHQQHTQKIPKRKIKGCHDIIPP